MESFSKLHPKDEEQVLSVEMKTEGWVVGHMTSLFEGDNPLDLQED